MGVAKSTLYLWRDTHAEFSDALARARDLSQAWFEDKGQDGLTTPGFNASLWAKQVSCRFREDYTDKQQTEHSGTLTGLTVTFVKPY